MKLLAWPLLFLSMVLSTFADAEPDKRPLVVAMPTMDDDPEHGIEHPLVLLVRDWGKKLNREIIVQRYPFKRSLMHAANGDVDFHFPLIFDPQTSPADLPFAYSTSVVTKVNFVLYTREGHELDLDNLGQYNIATFSGHGKLFPFDVIEDHSIEGSLRKLQLGRIDGYIFADNGGDPALLELGLTGIHRQLYKVYDVHAVLAHGRKGGEADQFITDAVNLQSVELQALAMVNQPYLDWQVGDEAIPALVHSGR